MWNMRKRGVKGCLQVLLTQTTEYFMFSWTSIGQTSGGTSHGGEKERQKLIIKFGTY